MNSTMISTILADDSGGFLEVLMKDFLLKAVIVAALVVIVLIAMVVIYKVVGGKK